MGKIVYETEHFSDEVFRGLYPQDSNIRNKEQFKEIILREMERDGVDISNPEELHITVNGAETDEASDGLFTSYVVTREYDREIPYEENREIVYEGDYILDGLRRTPEEQRQFILDQMEADGIDISNPEELEIGYDGATDYENGDYSETQYTHYVVERVTREKIDEDSIAMSEVNADAISKDKELSNEENREVVYEGDYILDGIRRTPEEQRQFILDQMEKDGIDISNPEELEIGYDGATDYENGDYSETQYTHYVVERVTREKIDDDSIAMSESNADEIIKDKELSNEVRKYENLFDEFLEWLENKKNNKNDYNYDVVNRIKGDKIRDDQIMDNFVKNLNRQEKVVLDLKQKLEKSNKENNKENVSEDVDSNDKAKEEKSALDSVQMLISTDSEVKLEVEGKTYKISPSDMKNITINISINSNNNAVKVTGSKPSEEYVPEPAPKDMENVQINNDRIEELRKKIADIESLVSKAEGLDSDLLSSTINLDKLNNKLDDMKKELDELLKKENQIEKEHDKEVKKDTVKIYVDKSNNGMMYVDTDTFDKYFMKNHDTKEEVINGIDCCSISTSEVEHLDKEKDSYDPPVNINYVEVELKKENDKAKKKVKTPSSNPGENGVNNTGSSSFSGVPEGNGNNSTSGSDSGNNPQSGEIQENNILAENTPSGDDNGNNPQSEEIQENNIVAENTPSGDDNGQSQNPDPDEEKNTNDDVVKYILYRDLDDNNQYYAPEDTLKRFGKYASGESTIINGVKCFKVENADAYDIINWGREADDAMVEVEDVHLNKENMNNITVDKYYLYKDLDDNNQYYAPERTLKRFKKYASGEPTIIDGVECFKIDDDVVNDIMNEARDVDSEYINDETSNVITEVEVKEVHLKQNNEVIYIYRDLDDDNQLYASREILERFGIEPTGNATNIEGEECYKITDEEDKQIHEAAEKEDPKVDVEYKDVHLKELEEETIIIYRDVTDNGQLYASTEVLERFGIIPDSEVEDIEGKSCYKISHEDDKKINIAAHDSENPKIKVEYRNVKLKQKAPKPTVNGILAKVTDGLGVIPNKTGSRFNASNIKVSSIFKNELHSGNYLYNIVHFVPGILKTGFGLLKKLGSKLFLRKKGREMAKIMTERLDDLTEEELEVLFNEYKGSRALQEKGDSINPLIANKLREYALGKVFKINEDIKANYNTLFACVREIKKLQDKSDLTDVEQEQLSRLFELGANCVKNIRDLRVQANNMMSSGIHGIQEDFKAVNTKLNYVGLRFGKQKGFDSELEGRLGVAEDAIEAGIYENDCEKVVESFMEHERLFFENSKIKGSVFGKRSVGDKYYSPLIEELDYRDDPFVRDLITTVAVTASAVNLVNTIRTKIQADQMAAQHNQAVNQANQYNQAGAQGVRNKGNQLVGHADEYRKGVKKGLAEDVGYARGNTEVGSLDANGWNISSSKYHVMDAKYHKFWNHMNDVTQRKIGKLNHQLSSGAINDVQYFDQLEKVVQQSQQSLSQAVNMVIKDCTKYAKSHPQFNLKAAIDSMNTIVNNPNAINSMVNAMGDSLHIGESLANFQALNVPALAQLPDSVLSTIFATATTSALALKTMQDAKNRNGKKMRYGSEIHDQMEEMFGDGAYDQEENYDFEEEENYDVEQDDPYTRRGR